MKIALWCTNLASRVRNMEEWIGRVESQMMGARAAGCDLLMMPEYACMAWLDWRPKETQIQHEVSWLGKLAPAALGLIQGLVQKHSIGILPGTFPAAVGTSWVNRAPIFLPENGRVAYYHQEKMHPIPSERNRHTWLIEPGRRFQPFVWKGLKIGIMICHDTASDSEAKFIKPLGLDLMLVPSMTETESHVDGHRYIFKHAQERSKQFGCAVAAVGAVGTQKLTDRPEKNVGGAALYVSGQPAKEIGPFAESKDFMGPMLFVSF